MEGLYQWIGSIVSYLVFVTVLIGLLPAARYERYLRLFAGCILILLVFQPVTVFLHLEKPLDQLFRRVSLREEAVERMDQKSRGLEEKWEPALNRMEEQRLDLLFSEYERETASELSGLAEEEGFQVLSVQTEMERNPESPDFAKIKQVTILVKKEAEPAAFGEKEMDIAPVAEIEVQKITCLETGNTNVRATSGNESTSGGIDREPDVSIRKERQQRLKKQIAAYYQVEEAYVEIRMEDG